MDSPAGRSRKRKGSGGERRVLMLTSDNVVGIGMSISKYLQELSGKQDCKIREEE